MLDKLIWNKIMRIFKIILNCPCCSKENLLNINLPINKERHLVKDLFVVIKLANICDLTLILEE